MKIIVFLTPKEGSLDPQGAAVEQALHSFGYQAASQVRMGRTIEWMTDEEDSDQLHKKIDQLCQDLLSNPVIEDYRYELVH